MKQKSGLFQSALRVPLSRGLFAYVDLDDYERVMQHKWSLRPDRNASYAVSRIDGKHTYLHRFIADAPPESLIDHADGDGLNNRKSNLRICDRAQNGWNRGPQSNNTSGFKGVYRNRNKWQAIIHARGERVFLGEFDSPEAAHHAYKEAALERHGDYAQTAIRN